MAPDRIHVTNVIVDDETSARAWGHCTVRGCKATMSCGVSWQPDHAIFTCFKKKEHHHPVPPEGVRREALELSVKTKGLPALRTAAELLGRMPAVLPSDQPTGAKHMWQVGDVGEGSQLTQLLRKTAH